MIKAQQIENKTSQKSITEAKALIKKDGGKVWFKSETGYRVTVEGPENK